MAPQPPYPTGVEITYFRRNDPSLPLSLVMLSFPTTGTVDMAYVYLIRCLETPFYKIGVSKNVGARLTSLQAACPLELQIIHTFAPKHPRRIEYTLHQMFDKRRYRGEWFELEPADLAFISNLTTENVGQYMQAWFIAKRRQKAVPLEGIIGTALTYFLSQGYASISSLQQHLGVGYERARIIVGIMEERGYVGEGAIPRAR